MHHYLKFLCGLSLTGLLATACKKEEMIAPEQPVSMASTSGNRLGGFQPLSKLRGRSEGNNFINFGENGAYAYRDEAASIIRKGKKGGAELVKRVIIEIITITPVEEKAKGPQKPK